MKVHLWRNPADGGTQKVLIVCRQDEKGVDPMSESDLKLLSYSVAEDLCDSQYLGSLQISVNELLSTSPTVCEGSTYVLRGEYVSADPAVAQLCLSGQGRTQGKPAPISEGSAPFEVTAEPLEVVPGKETIHVHRSPIRI